MDTFTKNTILIFIIFFATITIFCIYGASKQAKIYNIINNTNFTTSDFFWASEQINTQSQTINLK